MPKEELRKTLDELHQELAGTSDLDADTRERLQQTILDIQALLAKEETHGDGEEHSSFLEEWVRDFETAHPKLAYTIGRVVDLLAQSGI